MNTAFIELELKPRKTSGSIQRRSPAGATQHRKDALEADEARWEHQSQSGGFRPLPRARKDHDEAERNPSQADPTHEMLRLQRGFETLLSGGRAPYPWTCAPIREKRSSSSGLQGPSSSAARASCISEAFFGPDITRLILGLVSTKR